MCLGDVCVQNELGLMMLVNAFYMTACYETFSDIYLIMVPVDWSNYMHMVLLELCESGNTHFCLMFYKHNLKPFRLTSIVSIILNWEK